MLRGLIPLISVFGISWYHVHQVYNHEYVTLRYISHVNHVYMYTISYDIIGSISHENDMQLIRNSHALFRHMGWHFDNQLWVKHAIDHSIIIYCGFNYKLIYSNQKLSTTDRHHNQTFSRDLPSDSTHIYSNNHICGVF